MQELRTPHLPQTCVHGHEIGKVGAGRRGRLVVVSLRDGVVHISVLGTEQDYDSGSSDI